VPGVSVDADVHGGGEFCKNIWGGEMDRVVAREGGFVIVVELTTIIVGFVGEELM
jgi:hypothetical protein